MNRAWGVGLTVLLASSQMPVAAGQELERGIDPDMLTEGFLGAHPDIRWQREGMHSFEQGQYEIALAQFMRAARHADKLSQAMIANMYWEGTGVERDRELGYAWMDIAAERLYPDLIAFREHYWAALDPAAREAALRRGREIMAEFGDAAAKPRLEAILAREHRRMTGSRTGLKGNVRIIPFTGPLARSGVGELSLSTANAMTVSGDEYYADRYWVPEQYWRMRDLTWNAPDRSGHVDVGAIDPLREEDD